MIFLPYFNDRTWIFFIGTTVYGHTSKDHLEIGKKVDEMETKLSPKLMADIKSCKGESSCLKPLADDYFQNITAKKNEFLESHGITTLKTTDITE